MAASKSSSSFAGYLQEVSIPYIVGLFIAFQERPHHMAFGFPRGSETRVSKEVGDLVFAVTDHSHFYRFQLSEAHH